MGTSNDDLEKLTEINVEVFPLEDNAGSAVIVDGVIPEAVGDLLQALIGYSVATAFETGVDIESMFKEALELNTPRDPSTLH